MLPHARKALDSLEQAHVAVASVMREGRASVTVLANESISTYLLPRVLLGLRETWPGTRFAVTVGTCPIVRDGLASGAFDLGLLLREEERTRPSRAAGRRPALPVRGAIALAEVPLVLFSAPQHPMARSAAAVPRSELAPYRVFVSDASGDFHTLLADFFAVDALPAPRLEPTGSIEAVKRSVLTDPLALGVLPDYALAEELQAGRVRALSVRPGLPRVRLEALLSAVRPTHPATTEFVEMLRATLVDPQRASSSTAGRGAEAQSRASR